MNMIFQKRTGPYSLQKLWKKLVSLKTRRRFVRVWTLTQLAGPCQDAAGAVSLLLL